MTTHMKPGELFTGVKTIERKTLDNLTTKDLTRALNNSGYFGNLFTAAHFEGFTESGDAIYAITFRNDDDQLDCGFIYVRNENGKLLGEF